MAEDQEYFEHGRQSTVRPKVYGGYKRRKCNMRLEELAKPKKWTILATWKEYRDIFALDRMRSLKAKIQEEFSMTPEETEVYFSQMRKRAKRVQNKKALEKYLDRERAAAKKQAYSIFRNFLTKAMRYAFKHPPPPIVSPMIRSISDKVLELLCELHSFEIPKRDCTDKDAQFLLNISDWAAVLIGNIYYEVEVNEKSERLMTTARASHSTVSKYGEGEREPINENVEEEGVGQRDEIVIKTEDELLTKDEIKTEPPDWSTDEDEGHYN